MVVLVVTVVLETDVVVVLDTLVVVVLVTDMVVVVEVAAEHDTGQRNATSTP